MGAQKNAPQKVLVTLFPYIFHVKPQWNIVYEYLKTKIFSRDSNILPQMHWISNIFGHSATIIGRFLVSLNYPIWERYAQKTSGCGTVIRRLSVNSNTNFLFSLVEWLQSNKWLTTALLLGLTFFLVNGEIICSPILICNFQQLRIQGKKGLKNK